MFTPLTTPDGFPRADIDVAIVRATRANIRCLRTDYVGLMARVEVAVHAGFAANGNGNGNENSNGNGAAPAAPPPRPASPFARIRSVEQWSPAADAGLRAGDGVTRVGGERSYVEGVAREVRARSTKELTIGLVREGREWEVQILVPPLDEGPLGICLEPMKGKGGGGYEAREAAVLATERARWAQGRAAVTATATGSEERGEPARAHERHLPSP